MADRVRAAGEHPVTYGVATGRFAIDRAAEFWLESYLADPAGTAATIDSLAPVLAVQGAPGPVAAAGEVDEFAHLFPPTTPAELDAAVAAGAARLAAMSDAELEVELFGPQA